MPAITCRDCSAVYNARRKDATRCPSCRLFGILTYATKKWTRPKACRICSKKFLPMRGKDFAYCGMCELEKVASSVRGTGSPCHCKLCGKSRPSTEGVEVCRVCIKDPEIRPKVMRGLLRGQADRKADANNDTAP